MPDPLKFKVSSALKDIIGRDLITDDFIAVFELVKNSFDAYASRVDIYFENLREGNSKIIIVDNGKGMNYADLTNKWLFVAYSAKKEGTEDENLDYRNNIYTRRPFAGAKGIGRFSCDRLGRNLYLETIKNEANPTVEILITEWEKFEKDIKDEFIDISIIHESRDKTSYPIKHGTVLEITNLRSEWDRPKLLKLKNSLAKLINPSSNNGEHEFKIFMHVPDEEHFDKLQGESYNVINGEVRNFIFETLGLKTTKITSSISEDGKFVTTSLFDGGTLIYEIVESNEFNLLYNIFYTIYYLNQSAKITFTRRMGLSSGQFGHIFLYKNGFRVYPYGEPGEDPLKIDVRKAQGLNRYLGTRELIGQIEIFSDTNELKEPSSRGDGLIKTDTYYQLVDCFWKVLKRLEKYVIDVQHWGISIEDGKSTDLSDRINELISKLADSDKLIDIKYSIDILEKVELAQAKSATKLVNNLRQLALTKDDSELLAEANLISNRIELLQSINTEVIKEKDAVFLEKELALEKLEITKREVELLKETSSDEIIELLSIEHHVNQATFRVDGYIRALYEIAKENSTIQNSIVDIINNISLENKKIASLVKFVRRANFDLLSGKIEQDLVVYIDQYIKNVYRNDRIRRINKQLVRTVNVEILNNASFFTEFTPLEINIILDNMLDNSFKAKASEVNISIQATDEELVVSYRDNGVGVNNNVKDSLFEFGVTTTNGSGIGLFHVRKLIRGMGGDINLNESKYGANFVFTIKK